jgi:triosephosphate isomerase
VICPPFPYLAQVAELLRTRISSWARRIAVIPMPGAYTGEVAAAMLRDCGCAG